jgi:hypothetical protein
VNIIGDDTKQRFCTSKIWIVPARVQRMRGRESPGKSKDGKKPQRKRKREGGK